MYIKQQACKHLVCEKLHSSLGTLQGVLPESWEMQTVLSAEVRSAWALVKCCLHQPGVGSTGCCLFYKATKTRSLVY